MNDDKLYDNNRKHKMIYEYVTHLCNNKLLICHKQFNCSAYDILNSNVKKNRYRGMVQYTD